MRLFVAAWPDAPTRDRLAALELGRAKNLRLVGPTRWHVTLRFLGDVAEERLASLGDALVACATAQPGPVVCRLGPGTGWFTGVRVLQVPPPASTAWPTPCVPPPCLSCRSRRGASRPSTAI